MVYLCAGPSQLLVKKLLKTEAMCCAVMVLNGRIDMLRSSMRSCLWRALKAKERSLIADDDFSITLTLCSPCAIICDKIAGGRSGKMSKSLQSSQQLSSCSKELETSRLTERSLRLCTPPWFSPTSASRSPVSPERKELLMRVCLEGQISHIVASVITGTFSRCSMVVGSGIPLYKLAYCFAERTSSPFSPIQRKQ